MRTNQINHTLNKLIPINKLLLELAAPFCGIVSVGFPIEAYNYFDSFLKKNCNFIKNISNIKLHYLSLQKIKNIILKSFNIENKMLTIQMSNLISFLLFLIFFCINGYAQFPNIPSVPQPYSYPNYNNSNRVNPFPQPNANVPQPNGMNVNSNIQEQNARLIQEIQQHQRQMQMANQMQINEAMNEFEPKGLNMDVCRTVVRLPDYSGMAGTKYFHNAFDEINRMLTGEASLSLKDATFLVENAFYENTLSYADYNKYIREVVGLCQAKMKQDGLNEKDPMAQTMMLFHFMTDTFNLKLAGNEKTLVHYPMEYDTEDPGGEEDRSKMFVTKLMATNSGQCSTLPRLYLILAEAMGTEAFLSHAPLHAFVKIKDNEGNWYNLELTSGTILHDQHQLLNSFMKAEALRNRLYLEPMTPKQTVGDMLIELASAYMDKYGIDGFVAQCYNTVLHHDPTNIRAHILRSNYHSANAWYVIQMAGITSKEEIAGCPSANRMYQTAMRYKDNLFEMGYEPMPRELYQTWLQSVHDEKNKSDTKKFKLQYIIK